MEAASPQLDLRLSTPIGELPGVGKRRADAFNRLGIRTVLDLLRHLPTRYEFEAAESAIDRLTLGSIGTARGTVAATRVVGGHGRSRFEATLQDDTGTLSLTWFNGSYLRTRIRPGLGLRVQAKVAEFNGYPQMVNPRWEVIPPSDEPDTADERLRPVYPATEQLPAAFIDRLMQQVLPSVVDQITDPLDAAYLTERAMPSLRDAYRMAHQPEDRDEAAAARRRLAYNELLLLQMGIAIKRHRNHTIHEAPVLPCSDAVDEHIRGRFPFPLTEHQSHVIRQIVGDLARPVPMNRLLQGDVGAGKTVVALYALLLAVANRRQGALMAPTELLAEQHALSIRGMLEGSNVRVELLTGGVRAGVGGSARQRGILHRIATGETDLVIGTQALLTESVEFHDLAVVVIDEQHRFGVMQRAAFRERISRASEGDAGRTRVPHCLVMTATPIPRTLSLTVFGDLDVSIISGLPPGRSPIITRVVGEDKADEVYRYMAKRVDAGEQAYVVVPTIDSDDRETAKELKSVQEHLKMLEAGPLRGRRLAAVHGRLKTDEREAVMGRFRRGEIDVLVATTVIEVGVDVPNATMMVVEHAERFGLAQLHQLRGRIGRGTTQQKSVCVFITEPTTDDAVARMAAIGETSDGFRIAEKDLEIRGIGEFFGTRQSGAPPLRTARIPEDMDLLQMARRDAAALIESDPYLEQPGHAAIRRILQQQFGEALGLIDVG